MYDVREAGVYIEGLNVEGDSSASDVSLNVVIPASIAGKPIVNVSLDANKIKAIDVSKCASTIKEFYCGCNQLVTLDLSDCAALELLLCDNNQLVTINLSGCVVLESLYCEYNQLETLDLSDCTDLETVYCEHNQLTSLALTAENFHRYATSSGPIGPHRGQIDISNNKLTALDFDFSDFEGSITCYGNSFDAKTKAALKAWGEQSGNRLDW